MLARRWREFVLFLVNKVFCGTRFFTVKRILLNSCKGISIGKNTKIVSLQLSNCSKIIIGADCWIGKGTVVHGDGDVLIGDRCDIAPEVALLTGTHVIGSRVRRAGKGVLTHITVGNGSWIGARAMLIGSINIGEACVIGAGSVVTQSFANNIVLAGVPAKLIREL